MLHLLFILFSYGALLLLLTSAAGTSIVSAAVMFALGVGFIGYQKIYRMAFWKSRKPFPALIAICAAACLGLLFYHRRLLSPVTQSMAVLLHRPVPTVLSTGSLVLSFLSVYALYIGLQIITDKLASVGQPHHFAKSVLLCIAASAFVVILMQIMMDIEALSMGFLHFAFGTLLVSAVILFLYCLLGKLIPSILIGGGIFMILPTISIYVYRFRERILEPVDLFSARTALNVARNYHLLPIPIQLLIGWCAFFLLLMVLSCWQHQSELTLKRRLTLLAVCAVSSSVIFFYASSLPTHHWHKTGAQLNGCILDFVSKFKEISAPKPDDYDPQLIAKLADEYAEDSSALTSDAKQPHIIVIMDEAFSDLSVAGSFSTNQEVTPFLSSLKENTISGYALASIYGGNTANSEYEFLTGNSMAWLSPNAVPYQQYIRSATYSMVSYLKSSYGYHCIAMHPFLSSGWNRPLAYAHLGFDECYFLDDFPQKNHIRNYVSDREMFEFLIETYEAQKEAPLFLFGVTMQNHGDYSYSGDRYQKHISLNEHESEFPDVEQYLSLIHETDCAIEALITYFQQVEDDVVIVFFGDHQPRIDERFYETIGQAPANTLDEQQKRYKVPFFIWTNDDIEEATIDCTSLNYLSSYVYAAAGIPLPPYQHFLQDMEDAIPSINANGFYSPANEGYLPFDKASEEERRWLSLYEMLQYNSLFDPENQNETFFPVLSSI